LNFCLENAVIENAVADDVVDEIVKEDAPTKDTEQRPPPVQGKRAIISARYLPLLGDFRAKGDVRWYLDGILIEPHESAGAYLVATDGHRLLVIHDETAEVDAPMLVNPVQLLITQSKGAVLADFDGKRCDLQDEHEQFLLCAPAPLIDAHYPDWRSVVPSVEGEPKVGALSQLLLTAIGKAPWKKDSAKASLFHLSGPDKATTVRLPELPEILIVIMPVRHQEAIQRTPEWLRKKPKDKPAQQQSLELTGGDVDPPDDDGPVADNGRATAVAA